MNDFNIKKFLVENKMTRNSRLLKEDWEEDTYGADHNDRDPGGYEPQYSEFDRKLIKSDGLYLANDIEIIADTTLMVIKSGGSFLPNVVEPVFEKYIGKTSLPTSEEADDYDFESEGGHSATATLNVDSHDGLIAIFQKYAPDEIKQCVSEGKCVALIEYTLDTDDLDKIQNSDKSDIFTTK